MSSSGGFDRLLLNGIADLEKVTTTPEDVSAADLPDGLTRAAVLDALHVNLIWTIVNRLANAFGYRFPGFLTSGIYGTATGDRHERLVANLRTAVFDPPVRRPDDTPCSRRR